MKKLILTIAIVAFVSLGFTYINTPVSKKVSKVQYSEKIDFSSKLDEKRLARWD